MRKEKISNLMKEVAQLLNEMQASGVIFNYALFGAVAQMRYTEPVATLDVDVLVAVPAPESLDVLTPIYKFCAAKGYEAEGEAIQVGAWPVQFIPVFNAITQEALEEADTVEFEGIPLKVVGADCLAVIALSVGRAKDFTRVLSLIESGTTTPDRIGTLAKKHGLSNSWQRFKRRFLDD